VNGRNYSNIDKYLQKLIKDIYPQPPDENHTIWAAESILEFTRNSTNVQSVLDLGCGQAFCQGFFTNYGLDYVGICLGEDYEIALKNGKNVMNCDFTFLPFENETYDMLYARHSLEHSPMPLLTLTEWYRVSKKYVALVLPCPDYWGRKGRNHYFVLDSEQWENLFDVAGFDVVYQKTKIYRMGVEKDARDEEIEYWFLLEKRK